MLRVDKLKKSFNGVEVVKQVSFDLNRGDVLSIRGRSGGGKTTLLRMMAGSITPDSGSIKIDGVNVLNPIDSKKNKSELLGLIGIVFQDFKLFSNLTVLDNLTIAPLSRKILNKKDAIKKADTILARLGMLDRKAYYPSALSGGQKQRAAIARALMLNPKIILFDEPTSALDEENTSQILEIIDMLKADGIITICVSHDSKFLRELKGIQMKMEDGILSSVEL